MWDGIEVDLALQDIRLSAPDWFNQIFMILSSKVFYLLIPIGITLLFLWCIDKKKGLFIGMACLGSMCFTMNLKELLAVERPFIRHPELIVNDPEAINAKGYSCPSGHSAISASSYGATSAALGKCILSGVLLTLTALIIFSRLYLGAHTPLDIIVSLIIAVASIIVMKFLVDLACRNDRSFYAVFGGMLICFSAMAVLSVCLKGTPVDYIAYVYGFIIGALTAALLEHRFCGYSIPDGLSFRANAARYAVGLIVMAVLLLVPMKLIKGDWGTGIGGFISMIWSLCAYPMVLSRGFLSGI